MTVTMARADDADKQRAFLSLLSSPVITPWTDPTAYTIVRRHARTIDQWCRRLDYRLVHLDQCYRLRRVPLAGGDAVGHRAPPERAELLLTLYAAACLDDHREDSITLQDLSDLVRLSAAGRSGWPYDPNVRRHRTLFLRSLDALVAHGVIERRTDDAMRTGWEQTGTGIGGGFLLHRDALVLLIDTGDVDLALSPRHDDADLRGARLLRRLVETQALYPDELTDDERAYLHHANQRTRIAGLAEEMTGGTVEHRSDAIVLTLPPDRSLPDSLVIDFPTATARDWVALAMLDRLTVQGRGSDRHVAADDVLARAEEVHREAGDRLTAELKESPRVIVDVVAARLADLGLVRIDGDTGDWTFTPLSGRYREAKLEGAAEALSIPQDALQLGEEA